MQRLPDMPEAVLAFNRAKEAAGGLTALANAIAGNITPQAICQWRIVPAPRVLEVERVSGVSRHELRPDIYPPPEPITKQQFDDINARSA